MIYSFVLEISQYCGFWKQTESNESADKGSGGDFLDTAPDKINYPISVWRGGGKILPDLDSAQTAIMESGWNLLHRASFPLTARFLVPKISQKYSLRFSRWHSS